MKKLFLLMTAILILGSLGFAQDFISFEVIVPEVPTNNSTTPKLITFPTGGVHILEIGDGDALSNNMPFGFHYSNSWAQCLYYQSEIGLSVGAITAIMYKNNFTMPQFNKRVRVFMGNTAQTAITNWIPASELTMVFDGNIDAPNGINDVLIALDNFFVYEGNNLVVLTHYYYEPNYYMPICYWYHTQNSTANRSRYYCTDTNQGDAVIPTGTATVTSSFPNTKLFFATDTGTISGIVTTNSTTPVEGAKIEIIGTTLSSITNAAGEYSFPAVLSGTYNLKASKIGYETYTGEVTVTTTPVTHNFTLNEIPIPPNSVFTVINAEATQAIVTWGIPGPEPFDDYITWAATDVEGRVGTSAADLRFAHRFTPADLAEFGIVSGHKITKMAIGFGENLNRIDTLEIRIWEGGNGVADEGILVYKQSVTGYASFPINSITEIPLTTPFIIDATKELRIGYRTDFRGAIASGAYPAGSDAPGSIVPQKGSLVQCPDPPLHGGAWICHSQFGASTWNFNYIIKAWVGDAKKGGDIEISHENINRRTLKTTDSQILSLTNYATPQTEIVIEDSPLFSNREIPEITMPRGLTGYNVYRLQEGQQNNPSLWTQLATNINATIYIDDISALASGSYRHAVEAVYTEGTVSVIKFGNLWYLGGMTVSYTLNITTNSNDSVAGAVVTMLNIFEPSFSDEQIATGNAVIFPSLRKGKYNIKVTLTNHHPYTANNIVISEDGSHTATLLEIIVPPYGLEVNANGNNVLFSWNNNYQVNLFDDFESYTPFQVANNLGEWKNITTNNSNTYTQLGVVYPNATAPKAWMVFNVNTCTPSMASHPHFTRPPGVTGTQMAISWACETGLNDDYLISPLLDFRQEFVIEFWARELDANHQYGQESFRVLYSTTGDAIADLTHVALNVPHASCTWQKYSVTIPPAANHVAIHCNSNDVWGLWIDEVFVGIPDKENINRSFLGYNVYLDGVKQNTDPITDTEYIFQDVSGGTHTAGVQSVYTSGTSEIITANFTPEKYNVELSVLPADKGTVTGAGTYDYGQEVTVSVIPDVEHEFVDWKENGEVITGAGATYVFNITGNKVLVANLQPLSIYSPTNSDVSIYPNPTTGDITISVKESSKVTITDITGKELETMQINEPTKVNLEHQAGIYIIKVESAGSVSTHRLVITK